MSENLEKMTLHFQGPFKFIKGENYLFDCEFVKSEGIYIWTIKDERNSINYIHYIGETVSFAKRQKEHIIQITGLNYKIIEPNEARNGIEKTIWNGMWRDKTKNAVANLIENYNEVSKSVVDYIGLINVYFAKIDCEKELRRHIEGCIASNLRNNYPHLQTFYPRDNRTGVKKEKLGMKIKIITDENIAGIDNEQII